MGKHYNWADVKDDYLELLPSLSDEDIMKITGLKKFAQDPSGFYFDVDAVGGSRTIAAMDKNDKELEQLPELGLGGCGRVAIREGRRIP